MCAWCRVLTHSLWDEGMRELFVITCVLSHSLCVRVWVRFSMMSWGDR